MPQKIPRHTLKYIPQLMLEWQMSAATSINHFRAANCYLKEEQKRKNIPWYHIWHIISLSCGLTTLGKLFSNEALAWRAHRQGNTRYTGIAVMAAILAAAESAVTSTCLSSASAITMQGWQFHLLDRKHSLDVSLMDCTCMLSLLPWTSWYTSRAYLWTIQKKSKPVPCPTQRLFPL